MYGNKISWGVDGFGYRHFICENCGARLGKSKTAQPFEIRHVCGDGAWKVNEEASVLAREDLLEQLAAEKRE